jgi:hypothetical protein
VSRGSGPRLRSPAERLLPVKLPYRGLDEVLGLTTLRDKLIRMGAEVVTHSRCVISQMAEVAVPRGLFRAILERLRRLWPREPVPGWRQHAMKRREDAGTMESVCPQVHHTPG